MLIIYVGSLSLFVCVSVFVFDIPCSLIDVNHLSVNSLTIILMVATPA